MARPRKKQLAYKICSICGKELPIENYYKDGTNAQGVRYRNECKECYKKHRMELTTKKEFEEFPIKHVEGE